MSTLHVPTGCSRGHVQPAALEDVLAIEAEGFRAADEHECQAATGTSCAEQCFQALEIPDATTLTVLSDGFPVGMFGVVPLVGMGIEPGWGVAWLLASNGLFEIKRDFLHQCRLWIDFLQKHYPSVVNYVHTENEAAIAWCKWVGFVLEEPVVYGVAEEKFHRAIRKI